MAIGLREELGVDLRDMLGHARVAVVRRGIVGCRDVHPWGRQWLTVGTGPWWGHGCWLPAPARGGRRETHGRGWVMRVHHDPGWWTRRIARVVAVLHGMWAVVV